MTLENDFKNVDMLRLDFSPENPTSRLARTCAPIYHFKKIDKQFSIFKSVFTIHLMHLLLTYIILTVFIIFLVIFMIFQSEFAICMQFACNLQDRGMQIACNLQDRGVQIACKLHAINSGQRH